MSFLDKSEIKYLFLSLFAILIIVLAINVDFIKDKITALNPILQFLTINMGLYIVFFFLFKSISLGKNIGTIIEGSIANIILFISLALIMPEYHVTKEGLVAGGVFGTSACDYFFGYIYSNFFGITGIPLVIMVYFVTFIILFLISSFLYKDFIKRL